MNLSAILFGKAGTTLRRASVPAKGKPDTSSITHIAERFMGFVKKPAL